MGWSGSRDGATAIRAAAIRRRSSHRLREMAGSRVRYGYRRLTVLLRREGWAVNAKRVYRLYREEGLQVRTPKRAKRAAHTRVRCLGRSGRISGGVWTS